MKKIPDDLPAIIKNHIRGEIVDVTGSAFEKIITLTSIMEGLEFGCVSCADRKEPNKGHRTIIDFMISHEQKVSGGLCELTTQGCMKDIKKIKQDQFAEIGIAHGHGHNRTFHSTLDDETLKDTIVPSCHNNNRELFPSEDDPEYKISRVSSIVVNIKRQNYVEINYRVKNLRDGSEPKIFAVTTATKEVPEQEYELHFTKEDLIKETVSKVLFPRMKPPRAFRNYYKEYEQLRRTRKKEDLITFVEKLARYRSDQTAPYKTKIRDFLGRLDDNFCERLKFTYDPSMQESYKAYLLEMFAFIVRSHDCPEWIHEFKGYMNEEYRNENTVIEKFLEQITQTYRPTARRQTSAINLADIAALKKRIKQKAVVLDPTETAPVAKIKPIIARNINKELICIEKLFKSNKDPELELLYAYAKTAMLTSSTDATFHDFENILDDDIKRILMSKEDITESAYNSLQKKEGRLDLVIADMGYQIENRIELIPINQQKIKRFIDTLILEDVRKLNEEFIDILLYDENTYKTESSDRHVQQQNYLAMIDKNIEKYDSFKEISPVIDNTYRLLLQKKSELKRQNHIILNDIEKSARKYIDICYEKGEDCQIAIKMKDLIDKKMQESAKLIRDNYEFRIKKIKKMLGVA